MTERNRATAYGLPAPSAVRERDVYFDGDGWDATPTGLLIPPAPPRPKRERPLGIDLFCGAGGFSCGVHQAGFHVIAAADSWATAAITYLTNLGAYPVDVRYVDDQDRQNMDQAIRKAYGVKKGQDLPDHVPFVSGSGWIRSDRAHEPGSCAHHIDDPAEKRAFCDAYHSPPAHRDGCELFWLGDVSKLSAADFLEPLELEVGEVDVVFGGPPCQGFSHAGQRNVMDPRNSLVFEFVRLILEIRPKSMIMENVVGMVSMVTQEGVPVVDAIAYALEAGDFGNYKALRKSMLVSAGAGSVLKKESRGEKERAKRAAAEAHDEHEDLDEREEQLDIFGMAGAAA